MDGGPALPSPGGRTASNDEQEGSGPSDADVAEGDALQYVEERYCRRNRRLEARSGPAAVAAASGQASGSGPDGPQEQAALEEAAGWLGKQLETLGLCSSMLLDGYVKFYGGTQRAAEDLAGLSAASLLPLS